MSLQRNADGGSASGSTQNRSPFQVADSPPRSLNTSTPGRIYPSVGYISSGRDAAKRAGRPGFMELEGFVALRKVFCIIAGRPVNRGLGLLQISG